MPQFAIRSTESIGTFTLAIAFVMAYEASSAQAGP